MDFFESSEDKSSILYWLRQYQLFNSFSPDELQEIAYRTKKKEVLPGDYIFHEGDYSQEIFFLLSGSIKILKNDMHYQPHLIRELRSGEIFGEMAFIDNSPRSTTVQAVTPCELLVINSQGLQANEAFKNKIIAEIAKINITRLRQTNEQYVKSLQRELEHVQVKNEFSKFFIVLIFIFGIVNIFGTIADYEVVDITSTLFNWTYVLLLLLPIIYLIWKLKYPLFWFGVTTKNLSKSFLHGVLYSALIGVLIFFFKEIYDHLYQPVNSAYVTLSGRQFHSPLIFSYFVHAYIQEFITRGVTQTSLQRVFDDRAGYKAVFMTSVMFGMFHLYVGIPAGFFTFIGSLVFGLIYNQTKNLLGVTIVHFFLGIYLMHLRIV